MRAPAWVPWIAVLGIGVGLAGTARGFSAGDRGDEAVHDRITDRAEALLEFSSSYRPLLHTGRGLHRVMQAQDGLDLALAASRVQRGTHPRRNLRQALYAKVGDVVTTALYRPEHHFFRDGRVEVLAGSIARLPSSRDAFLAGVARYQHHLGMVVTRGRENAFGCALIDLGLALHTLQDAYAHSNLAELSAGVPPYDADAGFVAAQAARQCLVPGARCDHRVLPEELRLTWFPAWEPAQPGSGALVPEQGVVAGAVDCPDGRGPSCYARAVDEDAWEATVEAACRELASSGSPPSEEAYAHTCFSKEMATPPVAPADPLAYAVAWDEALRLAEEDTARALEWAFTELSTEAPDPGSRCTEATLWDCLRVARPEECAL